VVRRFPQKERLLRLLRPLLPWLGKAVAVHKVVVVVARQWWQTLAG